MQKWQYISLERLHSLSTTHMLLSNGTYLNNGVKTIKMCGTDENEIIQVLNKLGQDGWEVVSIIKYVDHFDIPITKYLLKRPI